MKNRNLPQKPPLCGRALALSLMVAALSAAALENSMPRQDAGHASSPPATRSTLQTTTPGAKPDSTQPAPGNTRSAQTTLTPAAPVTSKVPASSEEDIRDIRQPRHLPTPIPWAAAMAGVIILAAASFATWKYIRRARLLAMAPYEFALQQLEAARRLIDPEHAREYCFAVSEIIRNYIEVQFHLHAPRLTTEEFLRNLVEVRESMLASHRALLGDFLQHCDLAKFAGWRYSKPALEEMHNTAADFVQQAAAHAAAPGSKTAGPVPVATAIQTSEPTGALEQLKTEMV